MSFLSSIKTSVEDAYLNYHIKSLLERYYLLQGLDMRELEHKTTKELLDKVEELLDNQFVKIEELERKNENKDKVIEKLKDKTDKLNESNKKLEIKNEELYERNEKLVNRLTEYRMMDAFELTNDLRKENKQESKKGLEIV
jgi:dsDNA-specific endonuclease/ATPase MutS2